MRNLSLMALLVSKAKRLRQAEPSHASRLESFAGSRKDKAVKPLHVGFLNDVFTRYPEAAYGGIMNVFYIYWELQRRGVRITWIKLNSGKFEESSQHTLDFVYVGESGRTPLHKLYSLVRVVRFCRKSGIDGVFADDWLFARAHPFRRLILQWAFKIAGLKFIAEERDPFVDYQIASERLRPNSLKHKLISFEYSLYYRMCDLIILPCEAYVESFAERGISRKKLFGLFRGIDTGLFARNESKTIEEEVKRYLQLSEKQFAIGFFGHMNEYRRIDEIVIPLIKGIRNYIPDAHIIIAGRGEKMKALRTFEQEHPEAPLTLLDFIPYRELPPYLAACDVLLSPLSTDYNFTQCAAPLKIVEALAVGKPIVATRTKIAETDYKLLRGIVWVKDDVADFVNALVTIHDNYRHYADLAAEQAKNIGIYSAKHTIPKIADEIEKAMGVRVKKLELSLDKTGTG